ncbi:Diadenosine tetraphosphate (Ap4A) hydrolase [Mesobacillus persicus]|uniref:Diadenosine tetraphosphate (Ap4A) hydrolase n=1 Tax=Mesobacillus persicus TaxID=930146 RepID=A0A1H7WH36_9BACI|nr:HIT family protein [Mesobacillus persicus]SEM20922.1 Diadenosine tetraphosphate (Ap4A) hydrolase [Mesobacillus persicus]
MKCIGCQLANSLEPVHVVFEDEFVCCFLDHDPFNEGHVLILPKNHIYDADELDKTTAMSIMKASMLLSKAIKRLFKPDGITICQNGGIFNELTHYHMHVVPRYKDQSFATFYSEDDRYVEEETKLSDTRIKLSNAVREIIIESK